MVNIEQHDVIMKAQSATNWVSVSACFVCDCSFWCACMFVLVCDENKAKKQEKGPEAKSNYI